MILSHPTREELNYGAQVSKKIIDFGFINSVQRVSKQPQVHK